MSIFSFMKNAGKNILFNDPQFTNPINPANISNSEMIKKYLIGLGINTQNIEITINNNKAAVYGNLPDQDIKEKVILAIGNIKGIAEVEDHLVVPEQYTHSIFYTIRAGDTFQKIALEYYDNANKSNLLFEANKYLINGPDELYPGLVIRIPRENSLD